MDIFYVETDVGGHRTVTVCENIREAAARAGDALDSPIPGAKVSITKLVVPGDDDLLIEKVAIGRSEE